MYRHILVPVDFSEYSKDALAKAVELAEAFKSKITVLHVVHEEGYFTVFLSQNEFEELKKKIVPSVRQEFQKLEEEFFADKDIEHNFVIRYGAPYAEIIMELEENDYDLVVVSSHGATGLKSLFPYGGTAEKVVRRAPVDVLVVRKHE